MQHLAMPKYYHLMNRLQKQFNFILLFLFLFFGSSLLNQAKADHIAGNDLSYTCTSTPGVWHITFVFFRTCAGIALCPTSCGASCGFSVNWATSDPNCSTAGSVSLNLTGVRDVNPNALCPTAKSICDNMTCVTAGTYTPGVERYQFEGDLDLNGLSSTCCNIIISWYSCCRSGEIVTGSTWEGYYTQCTLNRCVTPCNSSPDLSNDPFAVMCGGQPFVFNNGAVDPDNDSLTYAFTASLQTAGSSVTYISPYSWDAPMPYASPKNAPFPLGISCDPNTGDIMFTPSYGSGGQFCGVMAIEIKQWRTINGVVKCVGITRRDIQMWLLTCAANNQPRIMTDPSNGLLPKLSWIVCAGDQLCFYVIGKDTDYLPTHSPPISDTTYLAWNASLSSRGATFLPTYNVSQRTTYGPREDKYQFCWTPKDADATTLPYYFTVNVKDSRCPNPGSATRAISITVLPKADVTIKKQDLHCGHWKVSYTKNKPSQSFSTQVWNISYVPNDYSGMSVHTYLNTASPPNQTFTVGGKYLIELDINTPGPPGGNPCQAQFFDTITVDTTVAPFVPDTFVCIGNSITIPYMAKWGQYPYTFRWFIPPDTSMFPQNGPFYGSTSWTTSPQTTKRYTVQVRDFNGCRGYDSNVIITVKRLPVFLPLDSQRICNGDSYTMDFGNDSTRAVQYKWNTGIPADTLQTLTRNDSNSYVLQITDSFYCQNQDTFRLYVNAPIPANAGPDTAICHGDTATLHASGGMLYQWRSLANGSTILPKGYTNFVRVNPVVTTQYEVTVFTYYPDTTNKYLECSKVDTIEVTVNPLPVLTRPTAVLACKSSKTLNLNIFGNNQQGGVSVWSYPAAKGAVVNGTQAKIYTDSLKNLPADTLIPVPNVSFDNTIRYKYTAPASYGGCTNYDSAKVSIFAVPYVIAGFDVKWCQNAGLFKLQVDNTRPSPYSLWTPTPNDVSGQNYGQNSTWSGKGIDSIFSGQNKRYTFDPKKSGVILSQSVSDTLMAHKNILTYAYTKQYVVAGGFAPACTGIDTVTFQVMSVPIVSAGTLAPVCNLDTNFLLTTKASATTTGSGGYWTYVPVNPLNGINKALTDSQNFFPSKVTIPAGQTVYSWRLAYTDASSGCPVSDTTTLIVAANPKATYVLDGPNPVCLFTGNKTLTSTGTPTGGVGAYSVANLGSHTYFSTVPTDVTKSNFNTNDANLTAGTYTLTYAYSIQVPGYTLQCKDAASVQVIVNQPPVISIATRNLEQCASDTTGFKLSLSNDPSPYSYKWTHFGSGLFAGGKDGINNPIYVKDATDIPKGTIKIKVATLPTGASDPCPVASDSVNITIDPQPVANFNCATCDGCEKLRPVLSALDAGFPVTYQWTVTGGLTSSESVFYVQKTEGLGWGTYTAQLKVTGISGKNCSTTSAPQTIKVHSTPEPEFTTVPNWVTTIASPYFSFINKSTSPDGASMNYLWNLGPESPGGPNRTTSDVNPQNIGYSSEGTKYVILQATTKYGCWDTAGHWVRIDPDITVFIPNAFHPGSTHPCPNGDPSCNSRFRPAANGYLTIEIYIFNRWGQQVYFSTDANEGWNGNMDGKENGIPCQQDVYIYQINATSYNGKAYKYSGSITLLR